MARAENARWMRRLHPHALVASGSSAVCLVLVLPPARSVGPPALPFGVHRPLSKILVVYSP